jgi:ERCC4-type nuclease
VPVFVCLKLDWIDMTLMVNEQASSAMKSLMHFDVRINSPDKPVNPSAVETALTSLVDATTLALVSSVKAKRFVSVLHHAEVRAGAGARNPARDRHLKQRQADAEPRERVQA